MDALADRILAIPETAKWALAIVSAAIGLQFILRTDATVRVIRRWLLVQVRWVRRPSYRRFVKINGWLLFVLSALLAMLLIIVED